MLCAQVFRSTEKGYKYSFSHNGCQHWDGILENKEGNTGNKRRFLGKSRSGEEGQSSISLQNSSLKDWFQMFYIHFLYNFNNLVKYSLNLCIFFPFMLCANLHDVGINDLSMCTESHFTEMQLKTHSREWME